MNQTLQFRIEQHLAEKQWNKSILAQRSGIHLSDISRIFNGKRPFSLQNLDAITHALGLNDSTFYNDYLEECYNENQHLDKRRTTQFLFKCVRKGYAQISNSIVNAIFEEKSKTVRNKNLLYIFTVAEQLFKEGHNEKAYLLYGILIESLPRYSEELAISYLRRFIIVRLTEEGPLALSYVLDQLAYLPTDSKKEAYLWMMAFYYRSEQWRNVFHYAERLEEMVNDGDYYGRALQYKSFALRRLGGTLEEVLSLTDRYEKINDFFADVAAGNKYVTLLDYGRLEYADEYLHWLENRDDTYVGIPIVLEAFIELERLDDAETLINRFKQVLINISGNDDPLKMKTYLRFQFAHAWFLCKKECFHQGLNELLEVADMANNIGNIELLKRCLLMFWTYKYQVTEKQEAVYKGLLQDSLWKKNQKR